MESRHAQKNEEVSMRKILVVEDDESQRLLYRDELAEVGYEVILAANGKEALKQLDKTKPDLVILNIVMPGMDGMEALGRIIRKYKDVSVILNTSYPSYRNDFMSTPPFSRISISEQIYLISTQRKFP
jgi:two-component system response regulator (stage 0 sporulation protein F)